MSPISVEKTLGMLAMPASLVWLLILALAWLCLRRRQWAPGALALAAALLYAALGNIYLAEAAADTLERQVPPVQVDRLPTFDAVWVLGGGADQDRSGRPQLSIAGDRVFLAARLWHAGKARLLVASGVAPDGHGGRWDGGRETGALWRAVGVPGQAILAVPEPCWNTRDEIRACARLRAQRGWKQVALVSSASHLPRALALAAKAGLTVTPLGADRMAHPRSFQLQHLLPQGEAFAIWQLTAWEYLGRWVGR
jgi:uncharacterized SAM-binding protein YcdF (DUF218 family)